ncbi:MAG: Trm112 family protein, partial [Chloroflexi bacterium]|nr:Trm112 family protein [Chloroflexota bacterium]
MRKDLMDILACPMCKGDLELAVDEEEGDEVIKGSL